MPDFTSALYLGLCHDHASLRPWRQLTTGRPAALGPMREADELEYGLACFLGCEAVALGPSTFHLFWDLFDMLAEDDIMVHMDGGVYPLARWGVERIAMRGVPVRAFRSHDVAALQVSLATAPRAGRTPWVVADGLDPLRGQPVPLPDYLDLVRRHGGSVILDDTQALGILGRCPNPANPYGAGGAGVPAWFGLSDPRIIRVASLAKGFGAPLALIGGQRQFVERFKTVSKTRVHCSPPSRAALAAAWQALTINARRGDALRSQLLHLVRLLRKGLRAIGLAAEGGCFPIQTLIPPARMPVAELHSALQSLGVASVRHRAHQGGAALVSFLLSASHTQTDIATALGALRWIAASRSRNEIKNPALLIQE